jgi:hypothetical protein
MMLSGYEAELQRIESDIADLSVDDPFAGPINAERSTRYLYLLHQHASISGDLNASATARRARSLPAWRIFAARSPISKVPAGSIGRPKTN